jgi:hypothetical protein
MTDPTKRYTPVDEFAYNTLQVKRLKLRNEKLKEAILSDPDNRGRQYLAAMENSYYVNISEREVYDYSNTVLRLEAELEALREKIRSTQADEVASGKAKKKPPTRVLTVRAMSADALERIAIEEKLFAGGEDDL